jgi:hypothetical protein
VFDYRVLPQSLLGIYILFEMHHPSKIQIILNSETSGIFAILLHNGLCTMEEHKIEEYQMGFRPNRSMIDNIFIIRQIYEKRHEYNIELHNAFVDFMQAFDSVNRSMIPGHLKQYKVSRKPINLVQNTLQ